MPTASNLYISLLLWVSLILYLVALIPQIILNRRLRSAAGLSDIYLYAFFLGYITESYYVLCLDFHSAYTYLVPLACLCTIVMVMQRFYYDRFSLSTQLFALYGITTLISLAILPIAFYNKHQMGNFMGWIATSLWSTYQIPQIVKNMQRKSVQGFSFGLTLMFGFASACECAGALILGLPLQTMINGIRGLCMFAIFYFQFWRYSADDSPQQ